MNCSTPVWTSIGVSGSTLGDGDGLTLGAGSESTLVAGGGETLSDGACGSGSEVAPDKLLADSA